MIFHGDFSSSIKMTEIDIFKLANQYEIAVDPRTCEQAFREKMSEPTLSPSPRATPGQGNH